MLFSNHEIIRLRLTYIWLPVLNLERNNSVTEYVVNKARQISPNNDTRFSSNQQHQRDRYNTKPWIIFQVGKGSRAFSCPTKADESKGLKKG
jgi:hypothetical protein